MRRSIFLAGAAGTLAAAQPALGKPKPTLEVKASAYADSANGQWGASISVQDASGVLEALAPAALAGSVFEVKNASPASARSVVLTNLPAISTQGVPGSLGSPGSCEAQSFGYCLGAYTAARNPDGSVKWDAAMPTNAPSAAWLYQWEHQVFESDKRVCPQGSGAKPYADKLVATGAPSTADVPYNPHDFTTVKTECGYIKGIDVTTVPAGASRFLIGSYKVFSKISGKKSAYLPTFKALLQHGHAIAFSGKVARKYGLQSPALTGDVFTAPNGFIPKSGHGQVIVGYDDGKGPHGAFLVQNSFGPGWNPGPSSDPGRNGRIWWDYDAWFASQNYALVMYSNAPLGSAGTALRTSGSGPRLLVTSAHSYTDAGGKHHAVFVTQSSEPVTITKLHVVPKTGKPVNVKLDEKMRLGYQYVTRKLAFPPGPCAVAYTVTTTNGNSVTYTGSVDITPQQS